MLIPPKELRKKFLVAPAGVLHVGAHRAEELPLYREENFGKIIWVEAQPDLVDDLRRNISAPGDTVLQGAVWGASGISKTFHVTNNGESSSLYELAEHTEHYPSISEVEAYEISTVRLDELIPAGETFDFVNLDVQGAELEALVGLGKLLDQVMWVYSEVNRAELYAGIPLVEELDLFLRKAGFIRVFTRWTSAGWGDAIYCRPSFSLKFLLIRIRGVSFEFETLARVRLKAVRAKLLDPIYRWLHAPRRTKHSTQN